MSALLTGGTTTRQTGRSGALLGRPGLTRPAMFGLVAAALLVLLGAVTSQGARGGDEGNGSGPSLPPAASAPV